MPIRLPLFAAPLAVLLLAALPPGAGAQAGSLAAAAAGIREADVRADVELLASDALAGRVTPSPELERAAEHVAARFRAAGLRPAGDRGGFQQRWTARIPVTDPTRAAMRYTGVGGRTAELAYGREFFVFSTEGPPVAGRAYFGGWARTGMEALPRAARGTVLVLRLAGDPGHAADEMGAALGAAVEVGALALVLVADPDVEERRIGWFASQLEFSGSVLPIPLAGVGHAAGAEMMRAAGRDLDSLAARPAGAPGVALPLRVEVNAALGIVEASAPNVVAVLPGSDPARANELVVLTAHFDHIGVGRPDAHGDSIFNGADDNASGTAALLEAAAAFGALRTPPARTVVFLAVSGEENFLLGSRHWVANPTVAGRVVANLNLDMVGRNAPDSLVVMGQEHSSLGPVVRRVAAAHPEVGLRLRSRVDPALHWFARSDHASFVNAGVPVLYFTALEHPDYHQATDEADRLDHGKVARVAKLFFLTAHAVASAPEAPAWTPTGRAEAERAAQY